MFRWLMSGVLVVGLLPLWSLLAAGIVARIAGCEIAADAAHPCLASGYDLGPALFEMADFGWVLLAMFPLAVIAAALRLSVEAWHAKKRLRKRGSTAIPRE